MVLRPCIPKDGTLVSYYLKPLACDLNLNVSLSSILFQGLYNIVYHKHVHTINLQTRYLTSNIITEYEEISKIQNCPL